MSRLSRIVAALWLLAVLCGTAPAVAAGDGINNGGSASSSGSSTITANSTATSGCGANGVLFSGSSKAQCDTGFTYGGAGAGAPVAIAQGTITTNIPALSITATWDAVGTTFDAPIFLNVMNMASAAGSLLADFQVGGTTKFNISSIGNVNIGQTAVGASVPTVVFANTGSNTTGYIFAAPDTSQTGTDGVTLNFGDQSFNIYNNATFANQSMGTTTGLTQTNGTHPSQNMEFGQSIFHFWMAAAGAANPIATWKEVYNISFSGSVPLTQWNYPLTIAQGALTSNSTGLDITQTWNNSGTVFDAPLHMTIMNTASAAGSLLADFKIGSSSIFSVDKAGTVLVPANGTYGGASGALYIQAAAPINSPSGTIQFYLGNQQSMQLNTAMLTPGSSASMSLGSGTVAWSGLVLASSGVGTGISNLTSAGTGNFQFGAADAASPVAQTLSAQNVVGGTSNTAGADWIHNASKSTGTGVGGKMKFQVTLTGTTGTTQNSNFPLLTLNPGGATTSTVQLGDGTNFTTYDSCTALTTGATGIIGCTASAIRFKELYAPKPLNLAGLYDLRTDTPWKYRDDAGHGLDTTRIHVGLFADDVERLDSRCIVKRDGLVSDYEDRCVIAYLVADRKAMRADSDSLRAEVEALRRSIAR